MLRAEVSTAGVGEGSQASCYDLFSLVHPLEKMPLLFPFSVLVSEGCHDK